MRIGDPSGFNPEYIAVKETKEREPGGKCFKYEISGVWELEVTEERWKELKGAKGPKYLLWPNADYPHLSIEYEQRGEELTLGAPHYSTSHDDSGRVSYKRALSGWEYQKPGNCSTHTYCHK